jgi:hypothetical protein
MYTKSLRSMFLILSLFGCRPEKPLPGANTYYPIEKGRSAVYEVARTEYSITATRRTTQHTIRQTIGESFTDAAGQTAFKLEYLSQPKENVWKVDSITSIWQTRDKVMGIENGQTIVKLLFPLQDRNVWDGNAYNLLGKSRYEVVNLGTSMQIGKYVFPKTVTIVRQNDSTLISQRKHIEVYAEGVGLIRKEIIYINFCYSNDCTRGTINSGWQEISVIKNYMQ